MSTMNISLPDGLKAFVDEQVAKRGYGTISEYVRELIRKDQERTQLRNLLLDGAASAPSGVADTAYFEGLRDHIRRHALTILPGLKAGDSYGAQAGEDVNILNATEARSKLYSLIDEAAETHQPIVITGKRGNAVLISEADWNAISETLHLMSVPGMAESIKEGMNTPASECAEELDW